MAAFDLDTVRTALLADLRSMSGQYDAVCARHDVFQPPDSPGGGRPLFERDSVAGLELQVDDEAIGFVTPLADGTTAEVLAHALEQLQGEVMEYEAEPWPVCPQHYHELRPEPDGDWVVWVCPTTEERIARFGALPAGTA
jgi:hypothetical protein